MLKPILVVLLFFTLFGCYTIKTDILFGKWRGGYGRVNTDPNRVVRATITTMSLYFHSDSTVAIHSANHSYAFSGHYYSKKDTLFLFSDEGNAVYLFKVEGTTLKLSPIYDENPERLECLKGYWSK